VGAEAPHRQRINIVDEIREFVVTYAQEALIWKVTAVRPMQNIVVSITSFGFRNIATMFGKGDQATAPRDTDGVMRVAGNQSYQRCDMFGPCAYVFIGSPETFFVSCDEDTQGKSAAYLRREFPPLGKKYCGTHIWARGYFVSTVGINSTVIQNYVKEQLWLWKDDSE
jgi:hypothetical protein